MSSNSGFFIQSRYGVRGNFEVIVPLPGGGFAHYWCDNDRPEAQWHGPSDVVGPANQFESVSLIESSIGYPGNLEVVGQANDRLLAFYRDSYSGAWFGPHLLAAEGLTITGVSGRPALIQSRFGVNGNFELLVPLKRGGIAHYYRDNDDARLPWRHSGEVIGRESVFRSQGIVFDSVAACHTDIGPPPGALAILARSQGNLWFFLKEVGQPWQEPTGPVTVDGTVLTTIANPTLVQRRFGGSRHLEALITGPGRAITRCIREAHLPGNPWFSDDQYIRLPGLESSNPYKLDAISCVESNLEMPGTLEVVARFLYGPRGEEPESIAWEYFHRDQAGWHGPFSIASGLEI